MRKENCINKHRKIVNNEKNNRWGDFNLPLFEGIIKKIMYHFQWKTRV